MIRVLKRKSMWGVFCAGFALEYAGKLARTSWCFWVKGKTFGSDWLKVANLIAATAARLAAIFARQDLLAMMPGKCLHPTYIDKAKQ